MAVPRSNDNPFCPGVATVPGVVAGRDSEIDAIDAIIARIAGPREARGGTLEKDPWAPLKITGPRGMGKTVLLKIAKRKAQLKGICVVDSTVLSSLSPNGDIITGLLHTEGWQENMWAWLSGHSKISSIGAKGPSFQERQAQGKKILKLALRGRLRRQPVLLLLDEAMHYDVASFSVVLQESLRLIRDNQPLAVIMAGTPSLDGILKKAGAALARDCEKKHINQVSTEEARKALRDPFTKAKPGIKVADDALELMVSWAGNYPYFIQLVGAAVWDTLKASRQAEVDLALVEKAGEPLREARTGYYQEIYEDIMEAKLLKCASQTIAFMEEAGSRPLMPEQIVSKLADANSDIDEDKAGDVFERLLDTDLVCFGKRAEVQAAIPSFFKYFKDRRTASKD